MLSSVLTSCLSTMLAAALILQVAVLSWVTVVSAISTAKVLVVSFDGFRYDYLNATSTPNMFRLREKSTYPEYMLNVFPTKTFSNHFSIATGMYAEEHGLLDLNMLENGTKIQYGPRMFQYNPDVVPIWILNEKQGGVSGSMKWGAGDLEFQQTRATFSEKYQKDHADWEVEVLKVIKWFNDEATSANLVMMYVDQPDGSSHRKGFNSKEVRTQIHNVDLISKYIDENLQANNLDVNVFLLSDHGMTGVPFENIIDITVEGNPSLESVKGFYNFSAGSPMLLVIPSKGKENEVFNAFHAIAQEKGHFTAYRKSELPSEWRVRNTGRMAAIILLADIGYCFSDILEWKKLLAVKGTVIGMHGYDNKAMEMHPFFLAWGPQIKKNHQIQPFNNVDLFSLWCKILGLKESANSGHFDNVKDMLVENSGGLRSSGKHWENSISSVIVGSIPFCVATQISIYLINRFLN